MGMTFCLKFCQLLMLAVLFRTWIFIRDVCNCNRTQNQLGCISPVSFLLCGANIRFGTGARAGLVVFSSPSGE